jgi:Uma2 family endonuclease
MSLAHDVVPRPMSVTDFEMFTDSRPEDERWELIQGVPVMSPSGTDFHQLIIANIIGALVTARIAARRSWIVLPGLTLGIDHGGIGSRLIPDVLVREARATGAPMTVEASVVFEVWSPSNVRSDRVRRLAAYHDVPGLASFVSVDQKTVRVTRHDKTPRGWEDHVATDIEGAIELPALGVALSLADLYRDTPSGLHL